MSVCSCTAGAALPSVLNATCPKDFGQVQKLIFQRIFKTAGTRNQFSGEDKITKKAAWDEVMAATDGEKAVITPYVEAPTTDGGDAITFGGGNETPGGVAKIIGRNPVGFGGLFRSLDQKVVKSLKALECEGELGVYLVNGEGQIMGISESTGVFQPIPIRSLFIGDLMLNGFETPDSNAISFSFLPGWSDNAEVATPEDFNALTDLVNAA